MKEKRHFFRLAQRHNSDVKRLSFKSIFVLSLPIILLGFVLSTSGGAEDAGSSNKHINDTSNTSLMQSLKRLEGYIEDINNTQLRLAQEAEARSEAIDRQRLEHVEKITENIYVSLLQNAGFAVAIVGALFTILNLILSAIIWRLYSNSKKLSDDFKDSEDSLKKMLTEVRKLHDENDALMRKSAIIQKELSRTVWLRYGKLPQDLDDKIPEDLKSILTDFLEYMNHIDNYRWAVLNSMSPFPELRIHALHTIATKLEQIPIARDYLERLFDVFDGPEFEKERQILKIALDRGTTTSARL